MFVYFTIGSLVKKLNLLQATRYTYIILKCSLVIKSFIKPATDICCHFCSKKIHSNAKLVFNFDS